MFLQGRYRYKQQIHKNMLNIIDCSCSVTKSCPALQPYELQDARFPCPSISAWVCSNSCPLSHWSHPTISFSIPSFSSCPQFFPATESFRVNWLFSSGGQNIRTSVSVSILPMNIQGWFPLELTELVSFLSNCLSRVFLSTRVWKHQFLIRKIQIQTTMWYHFTMV